MRRRGGIDSGPRHSQDGSGAVPTCHPSNARPSGSGDRVAGSEAMKLVLERFAHNALALLAVTTILFFMFRLMPGTPLAAFINENLNADQQQAMLEQFGLDRPMWQQYFIYLGNLLQRRVRPVVLPAPAGHSTSCSRCCPTR